MKIYQKKTCFYFQMVLYYYQRLRKTANIVGGHKTQKGPIMENKDNSIINSLKRLERVGGENSRVTRKLKKACCEVGKKIVELIKVYCEDEKNRFYCDVFPEIELPRGYKAIYISTNDTTRWTIMVPGQDPYEQHPYDRSLAYCPQDILRSDALQFSKDIAEGMLEEIVDWLEEKTAQINKAQEAIDKVEIK